MSLAGIAHRIKEDKARQVVVLVGAGASTAAGVPDFRSPTGLWSSEATRELFSWHGFLAQPEAFWRKSADLFEGRQPTKVHTFLAQLAHSGILRRIYTQNIDRLEEIAGVPPEMIIECHGSAMRTICSENRNHEVEHVHVDKSESWVAPRCSCGALLRPDIVFF